MADKIIIALPMIEAVVENSQQHFEVIYDPKRSLQTSEVIALSKVHQPMALLVNARHKVDADFISQLPESVKIIATSSVGFDHIDLVAARERKVFVTNTPDVLSEATADLAFLLLLAAARRLPEAMSLMNSGWGKSIAFNEGLGIDLRGKKLAIFGMGRIGQSLAEKGRAFGMQILYCNRRRLPAELEKGAHYFSRLEDMLPEAQVLSLNTPATAETQNIMDQKKFSLLPDGAIFINVARGNLVDEEALLQALRDKKLFAAGLDVFHNEPNFDKRFLEFKNVVLTPHVGSATQETRTAMGMRCLDNILSVQRGERPQDALGIS